ncbi:hypothetical protein SAMN06265365_14846 [Tistlia consotensis]|uniref:Uncharacterized protein n=1 Tax=Tistlia consotensis USBA 355 TaxID=560819 RepID=A0A1Y6CQA9_9PROT|nr:hypothetical protein [Tistlia consotensis]SMF83080.1 hypothetical protein SAMN05428998_14847 [Tistlia consotensis USBA 355]SNS32005.1 hypothetical protein SAMN06265365_14846 [Tistlia consotensis]
MTFVLADRRPQFDWKISVQRPDPKSGGKHVTSTFTARFDPLTPEEEQERLEGAAVRLDTAGDDGMKGLVARSLEAQEEDKSLLRRVWVGWGKDVVGQDNKPLEYSDELREQMIAWPEIRTAVLAAYNEAMNPQNPKGTKRGN